MQNNLWMQIGNICLNNAKKLLDGNESIPSEATVDLASKLVNIAIAIDDLNLHWEMLNR